MRSDDVSLSFMCRVRSGSGLLKADAITAGEWCLEPEEEKDIKY